MSTEEDHRKLFKEFCAKKYYGQDGDTDAAARSKAISQARGERIVKLQKDETLTVEPKFRYWVKKKGFKLLSYSLLGLVDVLCLPAKMKNTNDSTILAGWRRVAYVEDFYDIIKQIHSIEKGHIGSKKTIVEIGKQYDCVPRSAIDHFVELCFVCHVRKPQTTRAPLRPIISSGFMTRGQMDLIDMRHRPDGSYKWIGHYMDHWSKYHVIFPLMRKAAAEVAVGLQKNVLAFLGTPKILHSDNGREFVNEVLRNLILDWPGETTIVNGRPRNPRCQGLVEQGNASLEKLLGARMLEYEGSDMAPWTEWLSIVQYQLNTTVHGTMRNTPYELVFGQPPRSNIFPRVQCKTVMEEDVDDILTEEEEGANSNNKGRSGDGTGTPSEDEMENLSLGEESDPKPLATSSKHLRLRKEADKHYRRNAERMQLKYAKAKKKKVLTFSPGEYVSVRIPRIDRSSTDSHRLPCVVVERLGAKFHLYRLRCYNGVLKQCYGEGDLELFKGVLNIPVDDWKDSPFISLREASQKFNPSNDFHVGLCNCKAKCDTKRCSCRQMGATCSSKCHQGKPCANGCKSESKSDPTDKKGEGNHCGHPPKEMGEDSRSQGNSEKESTNDKGGHQPNKKNPRKPAEEDGSESTSEKGSPKKKKRRKCHEDHKHILISDHETEKSNVIGLTQQDIELIEQGGWLNDNHIRAAQSLLQKQFPYIGGLQETLLSENMEWKVMSCGGVQLLHVNGNHWVCLSTIGCPPDTIRIYDSMNYTVIRPGIQKQLVTLVGPVSCTLTVEIMASQGQGGCSDCGLFAIANAHALCSGEGPNVTCWSQDHMRAHLLACLKVGVLTPFPGKKLPAAKEELLKVVTIPVFCHCLPTLSGVVPH